MTARTIIALVALVCILLACSSDEVESEQTQDEVQAPVELTDEASELPDETGTPIPTDTRAPSSEIFANVGDRLLKSDILKHLNLFQISRHISQHFGLSIREFHPRLHQRQ